MTNRKIEIKPIQYILEEFDFEKVYDIMNHLDSEWIEDIPSLTKLKEKAKWLLYKAESLSKENPDLHDVYVQNDAFRAICGYIDGPDEERVRYFELLYIPTSLSIEEENV